MSKLLRILGYVWSAPVTVFGLIYALLFNVFGWHKFHGVEGDALVWLVNAEKAPVWLMNLWKNWGGHAIGNVVVLKTSPVERPVTLVHEQKHVDQCMRLGVFQPIIYGLCWLAIKLGCPGSNAYYDNCFEIDARRAAGQVIDVEGTMKKIIDQQTNKK